MLVRRPAGAGLRRTNLKWSNPSVMSLPPPGLTHIALSPVPPAALVLMDYGICSLVPGNAGFEQTNPYLLAKFPLAEPVGLCIVLIPAD